MISLPRLFIILSIGLFLSSCDNEPQPIEYGFDHCTFCEMTIVDKSHASIIVTKKGKTLKFDAIECMMRYYNREEIKEYSQMLVSDFVNPGNLISATEANYVISKEIPSPMGAYLSAIGDKTKTLELSQEKSGQIFSFKEIIIQFK